MTQFFRNFFICYWWEYKKCKTNVENSTNPSFLGVVQVTGSRLIDTRVAGRYNNHCGTAACTADLLWHTGPSDFQGLSTCSSQKHQGWIEPIFFTIFSIVVFKHNFIISLNQCLPSSKLWKPELCLLVYFYHAVNIELYEKKNLRVNVTF